MVLQHTKEVRSKMHELYKAYRAPEVGQLYNDFKKYKKEAELRVQFETDGETALLKACRDGDMKLAQESIQSGSSLVGEAFTVACKYNHLHLVDYFMKHEIHSAIVKSEPVVQKTLFTVVQKEQDQGDIDVGVFMALLSCGSAKVNENLSDVDDVPLLTHAATNGHLEVARRLLAAGAKVDAEDPESGTTALWHAAMEGHVDIVRLLVEAGACIEQLGDGESPLHAAVKFGHADVTNVLIEGGADVNCCDEYSGSSPLHRAAEGKHTDIVGMLLDAGANANQLTKAGRSPRFCAHGAPVILAMFGELCLHCSESLSSSGSSDEDFVEREDGKVHAGCHAAYLKSGNAAVEMVPGSAVSLDFLGDFLVDNQGVSVPVGELKGKIVGIYFAAAWCPFSRAFTPILKQIYKRIKCQNKPFEIVYASSDANTEEFGRQFSQMPWLAHPFNGQDLSPAKLKVWGLPTLILLGENGRLINKNGYFAVSDDPTGEKFPWNPETCLHCSELLEKKEGSYSGATMAFEDGKVHEECHDEYRLQNADICIHCGGPACKVEGKFSGQCFQNNDGIVHAECHDEYQLKNAERCIHCGGPACKAEGKFSGQCFETKDGLVHVECESDYQQSNAPRCLHCKGPVCSVAGKFSGKSFQYEGDKVHEECHSDYQQSIAPRCLHCKGPVCVLPGKHSGRSFQYEGGTVHEECRSDYQQSIAPRCIHCKGPVCVVAGRFDGTFYAAEGGQVHTECHGEYKQARYGPAGK
jgi:thiol-disulfide isomerase/thioredoxin